MTVDYGSDLSWKEHHVLQGDGHGGYVSRPASLRFLPRYEGCSVWPFGLAAMDNGEIVVVGLPRQSAPPYREQALVAFTRDEGTTWSDYVAVEDCSGRPMMLAHLGDGRLTFTAGWSETEHYRFFSTDCGRTWPERIPVQKAPDGHAFGTEGNALVDRDENGLATRLAETGQTFSDGPWPEHASREYLRWSTDGGRTWENTTSPEAFSNPQVTA